MNFPILFAGGGDRTSLTCDSADFNSAYVSYTGALSGQSDTKTGTISVWIRCDDDSVAAQQILLCGAGVSNNYALSVWHRPALGVGDFVILTRDSSNLICVHAVTSETYSINTWHHLLLSWDTSTSTFDWYINDTAVTVVTDVGPDQYQINDRTPAYSSFNWHSGAEPDGASRFWRGQFAELYFSLDYMDVSDVYVRRKFITSYGKPVNLGATGSSPTGTAPLIYFHLDDSETASNFYGNDSGNGAFSLTAGTVSTGGTSPSD